MAVTPAKTDKMEAGDFLGDSADPRVQQFRKHLEDTGLMETLTKMLMELYESNFKPENSFDYCRDFFSRIDGIDIKDVLAERDQLQERLRELNQQIEDIENPPPPPEPEEN